MVKFGCVGYYVKLIIIGRRVWVVVEWCLGMDDVEWVIGIDVGGKW